MLSIPCLFAYREKELIAHLAAIKEEVDVRFLDEVRLLRPLGLESGVEVVEGEEFHQGRLARHQI